MEAAAPEAAIMYGGGGGGRRRHLFLTSTYLAAGAITWVVGTGGAGDCMLTHQRLPGAEWHSVKVWPLSLLLAVGSVALMDLSCRLILTVMYPVVAGGGGAGNRTSTGNSQGGDSRPRL